MTSPIPYYCEIDFPSPTGGGRISGIFNEPECILTATKLDEVVELLSKVDAYAIAGYWVIGFVAYEAAAAFDNAFMVSDVTPADLPFATFAVYQNISPLPRQRKEHLMGAWKDETSRESFEAAITQVRLDISNGNYYQVNYTTRLQASFSGDGLSFFDKLKSTQSSAYCAYLDFGDWQICSVSPELFFHYSTQSKSGRTLTCRPMKGTAKRYSNTVEDLASAEQLFNSEKERAENLMIVDLVRNDLSRVALPASVKVPHLFTVEAWPTVWQMTSTIICRTHADKGLVDIFRALFPCGSITGAPKAAAMTKIKDLENTPRGGYCGAIGIVKPGGEALFNVGIRTPVINVQEQIATCGIGSGITIGSEAANEYAEWDAKQAFLRQACTSYELLETIRLHQGRYWLLQGHLQRIKRSAMALGFTFDEHKIVASLVTIANQYSNGQWRVRLRLSYKGEVNIDALPLDAIPHLPLIAMASTAVASDNPWLYHKTTRRDTYTALMKNQTGIFDTLLFNERNELTEFTRGNLIIELQGRLLTPTVTSGLLSGVFRETLLKRKKVIEAIVSKDDLLDANNIWFANSVRGAVKVKLRN
jgi:para-aminobenzoate synthetase/4-amino-4-deoxychorismate lyase